MTEISKYVAPNYGALNLYGEKERIVLIIGYHRTSAEVSQHLSLYLDPGELLDYTASMQRQIKFGPHMRHVIILVATHHCLKGLLNVV